MHALTLGTVDGVADRRANFDAVLTAMELRESERSARTTHAIDRV